MNGFNSLQQQALLEDLLMLLEDGVSVTQACEWMVVRARGTQSACLIAVLLSISHGQPLADGLQAYYPSHVVEAIRAGELSGKLLEGLRSAIEALSDRTSMRYTLFETLSYPIVVVVMGLLVLVFLKHSILDSFAEIVPLGLWPLHAQYLVSFANGLEHWWWLLLLLGVLCVVAIRLVLYSYVGRFRTLLDHIPLLQLYRQFIAAEFMQRLSLLISNGMMLKSALTVLKQTAPPYLNTHLSMMEYRLGLGSDNMGDVLNTGLIQEDDIRRLQLILETRTLEKALSTLGRNALVQGHRRIKQSSRIVAACLLLLAGLLAMFMILSIYDVGMSIGLGVN